jgi:hypothetical protein
MNRKMLATTVTRRHGEAMGEVQAFEFRRVAVVNAFQAWA